MNVPSTRPSALRAARFATGLLAALAAAPATAGPQALPRSPSEPSVNATVIAIAPGENGAARRVDLSIGKSLIVDLPRDAKEVFVANPKVANAVVRSTRKIFVIGMENGETSMFVMDADGRQIATLEITVGRDLNVLRETLRRSIPHAQIEVRSAGNSILLTGAVASASDAQQAADIANAFVGASGAASPERGAVINSLTIRGKEQVMLRVTVVEVARTVLKQFGINVNGEWGSFKPFTNPNTGGQPGGFLSESIFPISPQVFSDANRLSGALNFGAGRIDATLRAFERAGVSRILAEPTLVAISGESATFTAGGEIPVPTSQDCARIPGSSISSCRTSIEYKPFGVNLSFTPVVLSESRISMRVATEVTELDYENQFRNDTINIPGIKVRKSTTSVELPSGAVMMTAGLINQQSAQAVTGMPGLMNLPILGSLFRSRDYQRRETEMMILVTPYIAKPMEPREVSRPDDGFIDAYDGQTVLLGRLNKLYGVVGGGAQAPGYRGRFGFITD